MLTATSPARHGTRIGGGPEAAPVVCSQRRSSLHANTTTRRRVGLLPPLVALEQGEGPPVEIVVRRLWSLLGTDRSGCPSTLASRWHTDSRPGSRMSDNLHDGAAPDEDR